MLGEKQLAISIGVLFVMAFVIWAYVAIVAPSVRWINSRRKRREQPTGNATILDPP